MSTAGADAIETLIRDRFNKILKIMAGLELHQKCPKFFELRFDVDSDRSPHGISPGRGPQIIGASTDILLNQLCLLPKDWNDHSVDYVLVFGSKLLGKYVLDEKTWQTDKATFTQKLEATFEELDKSFKDLTTGARGHKPSISRAEWWQEVYTKIGVVRKQYETEMGPAFHHVLTELVLLRLRAKRERRKDIIPILLCETQESGLCDFIDENPTTIRLDLSNQFRQCDQLFKILLMFQELEDDRLIIEAFRDCFNECVKSAFSEPKKDSIQYDQDCERITLETLRKLTSSKQYKPQQKHITNAALRRVLNLQSHLEYSSISSISGKNLPTNLNDIDLAIRRDDEFRDPKKQKIAEQLAKRELVSLYDLFKERELQPGHMRRPNRILIQGVPGIGKTTLSTRIMYTYSWHKFKIVPRGRDFAKKLADSILKVEKTEQDSLAKEQRILLILDGLDETRRHPGEEQSLLCELLKRPDVIILSRFGAHETVSVDLELEAIGLSNESIQDFIDNTGVVATEDAWDIKRFLVSNQAAQNMVRVPINLDILCSSWDELKQQRDSTPISVKDGKWERPPTLTAFCQSVISKLWRKDIPRLLKIENGQLLTEEVITAVRDPRRLVRPVQLEIDILGMIAVKLLEEGRVEFLDRDIDEAISELEDKGGIQLPLTLENTIKKLSFLRTDSSRDIHRSHSFIHLAFQELFAAEYLARNPALMKEHLRKHKYNLRYQVLWRFVAGILPTSGRIACTSASKMQRLRRLTATTSPGITLMHLNAIAV
ncbi:hypothetical protein TWF696_007699 [Orbilia brochopaga]|uniref:NACHT domain-containing protein n=1 Tax=Orbilia brochopaga TaxID=3140254 RepID=A0AAV9UL53_9PEZI